MIVPSPKKRPRVSKRAEQKVQPAQKAKPQAKAKGKKNQGVDLPAASVTSAGHLVTLFSKQSKERTILNTEEGTVETVGGEIDEVASTVGSTTVGGSTNHEDAASTIGAEEASTIAGDEVSTLGDADEVVNKALVNLVALKDGLTEENLKAFEELLREKASRKLTQEATL